MKEKEKKEKKKVVFDAEDSANVDDIDLESFGKKKKKKKRGGADDLDAAMDENKENGKSATILRNQLISNHCHHKYYKCFGH